MSLARKSNKLIIKYFYQLISRSQNVFFYRGCSGSGGCDASPAT